MAVRLEQKYTLSDAGLQDTRQKTTEQHGLRYRMSTTILLSLYSMHFCENPMRVITGVNIGLHRSRRATKNKNVHIRQMCVGKKRIVEIYLAQCLV